MTDGWRCRICTRWVTGVFCGHTKLIIEHLRPRKAGSGVLDVITRRTVRDRKFTTAARDAVVDAFTNTFELENFNYHASGTGSVAESNADTALGTEVEASRVVGTQSQPTSDVYRTVGTITYTATRTITEHGIFSAASAGTLLDRTVFAGIGVVNNDSITFTFNLTIAAEA